MNLPYKAKKCRIVFVILPTTSQILSSIISKLEKCRLLKKIITTTIKFLVELKPLFVGPLLCEINAFYIAR